MDVRCGRCATEYEFDDALISERGTTVKCTNCGHQFKVYPSSAGDKEPERWVVRTAANRELVYTSLKDLQRGIARGQIGPNDMLSRGAQQQRQLGSIAELEPLFTRRGQRPARAVRTLIGGVGVPETAAPSGPPRTESAAPNTLPIVDSDAPPAVAPSKNGRPPSSANWKPVNAAPRELPGGQLRLPDPKLEFANTLKATLAASAPSQGARRILDEFVVPKEVVVHDPGDEPLLTPTPSAIMENLRAFDDELTDPRFMPGLSSQRSRSRWIILLVLVGLCVLLGATVGRDYLKRFARPAAPTEDVRSAEFVRQGYTLLEKGDFEGAKERFDKATALAERNPGALAGLAQLETTRADLEWLKLQLLDRQDSANVKAGELVLQQRLEKARGAVAAAFQLAAEEPVVIRARIDLSRLSGEQTQARDWVGPISSNPSDPRNAYTLAALDMAEPTPEWKTVIERLRSAAAGERGFGRARAALVYALARSGDAAKANGELEQLTLAGSHPLLAELKAFVGRYQAGVQPETGKTDGADAGTPADSSKNDDPDSEIQAGADFRSLLPKADAALKRGSLERAERFYRAVLARRPSNTEALAGLAEIATRRHDSAAAATLYDKVLENNPHYLPALIGSADQKWATGDRQGAIALYRRVVEQAGQHSKYGKHALERIALGTAERSQRSAPDANDGAADDASATPQSDAGTPSTEPAAPAPEVTADAASPEVPAPAPAPIDTTDLPELSH